MQVQKLVDVVDLAGRLQEAPQRPGEAARGIDHPMVERVAEPAAQRSHIVDLFDEIGVGRGAEPGGVIRREIIHE